MKQHLIVTQCQRWASLTGYPTTAYRLANGVITYQISGWPVSGVKVADAQPVVNQKEVA
jgi:hypothetical protein